MAGTVVLTSQRSEGVVRWAKFTCTADAADGSFPATTLKALGVFMDGTILAFQSNPGSPAPTDNYDVTLVDADGVDRLNAVGMNRDFSVSERVAVSGAPVVAGDEVLTLTITGNAVNSAVTVLTIYWTASVSSAAGGGGTDITAYVDGLEGLLTGGTTGTVTAVADAATNQTLTAANAARTGVHLHNDSDQTLYFKFGATATTSDFTDKLLPGGSVFISGKTYTGQIDGIWAANSTGSCRVTVCA